jgi:protein arginine kinase
MKLSDNYNKVGNWLSGDGPQSDIVISSRVRLARNVKGFTFSAHSTPEQNQQLLTFLQGKVMDSALQNKVYYFCMQDMPEIERDLLAERHLISKQLACGNGPRGVIISHDESLSLMINEEDHIRMQTVASGLQLKETFAILSGIDDLLEQEVEYSFSNKYGYLTACPTNVGTGIRVSVMLHLPALKLTGQMDRVMRATKDLKLAVRGFFGEGSEPIGDLFQLSNQITLGKTELEIIDELVTYAIHPIIEYERYARQKLLEDDQTMLDDKVFRALGALKSARLISSEETLLLLSYVRLGIYLGRIKGISIDTVNNIFLLTQPAHLQYLYDQTLDTQNRDEYRATVIRKYLK